MKRITLCHLVVQIKNCYIVLYLRMNVKYNVEHTFHISSLFLLGTNYWSTLKNNFCLLFFLGRSLWGSIWKMFTRVSPCLPSRPLLEHTCTCSPSGCLVVFWLSWHRLDLYFFFCLLRTPAKIVSFASHTSLDLPSSQVCGSWVVWCLDYLRFEYRVLTFYVNFRNGHGSATWHGCTSRPEHHCYCLPEHRCSICVILCIGSSRYSRLMAVFGRNFDVSLEFHAPFLFDEHLLPVLSSLPGNNTWLLKLLCILARLCV